MLLAWVCALILILFLAWCSTRFKEGVEQQPRIVVSMTTIPERVDKNTIEKTLQSLHRQTLPPDVVYIHVPPKTLKGAPYPLDKLDALASRYPLVKINKVPADLGPITKVVPVLPLINDTDYVVLVDDDVDYGPSTIHKLQEAARDKVAVGFAGRKSGLEYVSGESYEGPVDFLETYGGVLYRGHALRDLDIFHAELGGTCEKQDDIVLGKFMQSKNIAPFIVAHPVPGKHDAQDTPELRSYNLSGGQNKACYDQLFS